MGVPLKGLLGKTKRAIVVNGQLLKVDHRRVVVSLNRYRTEYALMGTSTVYEEEKGDKLILDKLAEFDLRYRIMAELKAVPTLDSNGNENQFEIYVDPYTGAIIIESPTYKALYSPHMHEVGVQHTPQVAEAVLSFVKEYTINYMDLFTHLFSRRISSPYSPITTRCHFVAGFFQPLMVESSALRSPFGFGQHKWFYDLFVDEEKFLERSYDSPRKLNLSCVALCDIATKFGAKVIPEFKRENWMFMCLFTILNQIDKDAALQLRNEYGRIFQGIMDDEDMRLLLGNMMQYVDRIRKAVRLA